MKPIRIVVAFICCFVLFELFLGLDAVRSRTKALEMLQAMDRLKLRTTSRAAVNLELHQLGLNPQDEACSISTGHCDGIGVELANYREPSNKVAASALEFAAERLSVFRPTYLLANFYFNSDRLAVIEVQFSTDKAAIGMMLASTDLGEHATTEWRRNNRTGSETFVRVVDPTNAQDASLRSAGLFDLRCMESVRGCNAASALWPSASQYGAGQQFK